MSLKNVQFDGGDGGGGGGGGDGGGGGGGGGGGDGGDGGPGFPRFGTTIIGPAILSGGPNGAFGSACISTQLPPLASSACTHNGSAVQYAQHACAHGPALRSACWNSVYTAHVSTSTARGQECR